MVGLLGTNHSYWLEHYLIVLPANTRVLHILPLFQLYILQFLSKQRMQIQVS